MNYNLLNMLQSDFLPRYGSKPSGDPDLKPHGWGTGRVSITGARAGGDRLQRDDTIRQIRHEADSFIRRYGESLSAEGVRLIKQKRLEAQTLDEFQQWARYVLEHYATL